MPEKKKQDGFPACISLTITFNDHAVLYQTVAQWIENYPNEVRWVSDEERDRAIESNSVWECHWYPDTPVGSYHVAASSFEALMAFVNRVTE